MTEFDSSFHGPTFNVWRINTTIEHDMTSIKTVVKTRSAARRLGAPDVSYSNWEFECYL